MLKRFALAAFFTLMASTTSFCVAAEDASKTETTKPNILFIFADDHAYQAVSAYGFGLNRTPNIDRIADEGMRFDRCLVTNAICGPSRATVLTGKYSHENHFYNHFHSTFDGTQTTLPKLLQEKGYQTAIVGKWHLVSDPTGFDYWNILPGQGVYYNPPMIENGTRANHEGYVTDIITDQALNWLDKTRDKKKPFLLMVHQKAPHREWEPALNKLRTNDGISFKMPPTITDNFSGRGKAEHDQNMMIANDLNPHDLKLIPPAELTPGQRNEWNAYYQPLNEKFLNDQPKGKELLDWKYQRYLHDYLACISSVDDSVGKLLDYLATNQLDKNTIVVYASDQGFFLGEHGWFDKRWIFEQSLKTPLVVRWPGVVKPGSTCDKIVSNVDFAETFCEAAGARITDDMQGHSFVSLLKGDTPADWRKSFYYHYYEHPGDHNVARHYGVVTDRYKLVFFYEPSLNYWELFDLQKDPNELKSVYDEPDYAKVQTELHDELNKLRSELKVPDPDPDESIEGYPGNESPPAKR